MDVRPAAGVANPENCLKGRLVGRTMTGLEVHLIVATRERPGDHHRGLPQQIRKGLPEPRGAGLMVGARRDGNACEIGAPRGSQAIGRKAAKEGDNGEGDLVRVRDRRRCGRRLARLLWRRGFARRHLARPLRRRGRHAAPARALRARWGIKTTWFIPGHSIETFPDRDEGRRRRRPRNRHPRLYPREPDRHDAGAGRGGTRQVHRPGRRSSAAGGRPAMSRRGGNSRP